ncbi:MAG: twin-arginine translocase subunit TatC [Paludibacteraceae bacterium]
MAMNTDEQSFWDHLDVLRAAILKSLLVTVAFGVVAFCFKEELFAVILAPKNADFVTYRMLYAFNSLLTKTAADFLVKLINTELAEQFIIHMKTALCAGVLCASPYILYQLFRFVSPALYVDERKYAVRVVGGGYAMFLLGVLLNYFLIFPFTFRFLGTYQVSGEVENMITLQSYISTLMTMSLVMGLLFEMPILSWLFTKLGFLSVDFMRTYRKHAVVAIFVVAAVITPTSDVFTLLFVSIPMYLLYEISIAVVKIASHTERKTIVADNTD